MKWISNKTLFNIHGWLGLNLGLLLFVICFSGTFATLSSEVDWLLNADMRVDGKDAPIQWEAMHQSLKEKYPQGRNLGIYKNSYAGHGDHFAATAYVSLPNGQTRKVYLNPYTGLIQSDTSFFNVQRFFRSYHRRFFDGNRGILIITLSSFFLLFSALTGFLFYKGWLKNLFKLRLKRGIKTLFSDAHKLTGIWSLFFTLLIALTGVFYFAELMVQAADNYEVLVPEEPAKIKRAELVQFGPNPELLPLDKYVANARRAFPELQVSTVRIPHQPNDYVYIDGQAGNPITRNRANKIYLHPFTGEVVHIQRSSELNTAEFITDIADPLHFGYFGGLTTKIIWFLFGLAISFAILTGTYLWYARDLDKIQRKLRRASSGKQKTKHREDKGILASAVFLEHLTLSRGAVISTIIVLLYVTSTGIATVTDGIRSYGSLPVDRFTTIKTVTLGSWDVDLRCEYPCNFLEGSFFARFKNEGIPNYASFSMNITTTDGEIIKLPFQGYASISSSGAHKNVDPSNIIHIQIVAESPGGEIYSAEIALAKFRASQSLMADRFKSYPEKSYPKVPTGIYMFIAFFGLCTITVLYAWSYYLTLSTSKRLKLQSGRNG